MYILGISAYYHDSAAVLLKDGVIVAAAQEERFTRKKHDPGFPCRAIEFCLNQARVRPEQVDHVAFYDKPFSKFERIFETYFAYAPRGFASFTKSLPVWLKEKLFQKSLLVRELKQLDKKINWEERLLFSEHHHAHAASTFYPSPFDKAVVLTMDGVGEWATTSIALGDGYQLEMKKEIRFPHSIGLLYSAFTYYLGFKVNSGEYKVMGLAPYGEPKYVQQIKDNLIDINEDGSFRLNMDYFEYCTSMRMTNEKFGEVFGYPRRTPEAQLEAQHMDLAASVQAVTEEIVMKLARSAKRDYPDYDNLCLAGGVALNCVANGKLLRERIFSNLWVQPAAGDAGGALGAATLAYFHFLKNDRKTDGRDQMYGSYLGPEYSDEEIGKRLSSIGARTELLDAEEMLERVSTDLASEKTIGWFQGRMEFGPRALGGRSIIADPRSPVMQKQLNLKIKYRESFRPFAPAVLEEDVGKWFELDSESPYMLLVADVKKEIQRKMSDDEENLFGIEKLNTIRSSIPAVTHVDYSARVQTVSTRTNPRFHGLISKFKQKTECPVVVNTSFNVRGEPIVCTPEDAFRCFMATEMDVLAVGNHYLVKDKQDSKLAVDYKDQFELD